MRGKHHSSKMQEIFDIKGFDDFDVMVLEECDKENLFDAEVKWVEKLSSYTSGFNSSKGGENTPMFHEECVDKAFGTRAKNGKAVSVYVYSAVTGEFLFKEHGLRRTGIRLGLSESKVTCGYYSGKVTDKQYHLCGEDKTPNQVLGDIVYENNSPEQRGNHSKKMKGAGNPMFGKKRTNLSGDRNPFKIKIANGFNPKVPKKLKITESEIVELRKNKTPIKELAALAGCGTGNINVMLRRNGLGIGKGGNKKNGGLYEPN